MKRLSADDSVGLPHVKVGHCQGFFPEKANHYDSPFFLSKETGSHGQAVGRRVNVIYLERAALPEGKANVEKCEGAYTST